MKCLHSWTYSSAKKCKIETLRILKTENENFRMFSKIVGTSSELLYFSLTFTKITEEFQKLASEDLKVAR